MVKRYLGSWHEVLQLRHGSFRRTIAEFRRCNWSWSIRDMSVRNAFRWRLLSAWQFDAFFHANIRSIMEYCCALMTNLTVSESCKLDWIQSRVCALVTGVAKSIKLPIDKPAHFSKRITKKRWLDLETAFAMWKLRPRESSMVTLRSFIWSAVCNSCPPSLQVEAYRIARDPSLFSIDFWSSHHDPQVFALFDMRSCSVEPIAVCSRFPETACRDHWHREAPAFRSCIVHVRRIAHNPTWP